MNGKYAPFIAFGVMAFVIIGAMLFYIFRFDSDYTTGVGEGETTSEFAEISSSGSTGSEGDTVPAEEAEPNDVNCGGGIYGPSSDWCYNYNNHRTTSCWDKSGKPWCCHERAYVHCGNDVCGVSQAWCDNYNNGGSGTWPVSCMYYDRNLCCNVAGHIIDYRENKCCSPSFPFLVYLEEYGRAMCGKLPTRNDNNGVWADNYLTRISPCDVAKASRNFPEHVDAYCQAKTFYECVASGVETSWTAAYQNKGEIIGKCGVTDPCESIVCNSKCQDTFLLYNGQCVAGNCVYDSKPCNVADFCDGNVRRTNGRCEAGQCVTDTEDCGSKSTYCQDDVAYYKPSCQNGNCVFQSENCKKSDWCEGTQRMYFDRCLEGDCYYLTEDCNKKEDYCEDGIRYYNADCVNGRCEYKTQACQHGCENGVCLLDPCSGEVCGNGECNSECGESLPTCFVDCAECGITQLTGNTAVDEQNCTTTDGKEGSQECVGGKWAECKRDIDYLNYSVYGGGALAILVSLGFILKNSKKRKGAD